jgi:hypothetical protein
MSFSTLSSEKSTKPTFITLDALKVVAGNGRHRYSVLTPHSLLQKFDYHSGRNLTPNPLLQKFYISPD